MWRRAFDTAERAVGPRLEEMVRTEQFAEAVGVASRARQELERRAQRASRRAWHLWNLPAATDVNRILERMGALERQVRDLSKRLEDAGEANDADAPRPSRARRTGSP